MPITSDARQIADLVVFAQEAAGSGDEERGFREIIDLLPAAIYTTDAEGCLTHFNPACKAFSGRTPELGTDNWCVTWKLYYPDGTPMPHDECPMAIALKEGRAVRGEQAIAERQDGTRIWFEPYPTPLFDADGRIVGGINMLIDITERKQVEAALRKSQQELADFFDNAAMGLHWVGPDGTILRANQAELDLVGYSRDEYVGHRIAEFHADAEVIEDILQKLQAGETLSRYEARLRCKDGSIKHVVIDSNVLWEDDRFIHTRCFTRDITEHKQAEVERNRLMECESEARSEAEALNAVARAVSTLDLESLVQEATDAATRHTGAKFGAFFYNVTDEKGESYLLYTLSGVPREVFEKFELPRNTPIFAPTFRGEGSVRIGDVLSDPRYAKNPPHRGMPRGHLPVRSYLAVPVVASSGEVLGGMFFGHPETEVFTERAERLALGIAAQAAIAIDNARLFQNAQREIAERKRAEEALRESEDRNRAVFVSAPMAIFVCDTNAVIQHYNARAAELWGREPTCGVEKHCGSTKLWLPDGTLLPHDQSPVEEVLHSGLPAYNVEVVIERPDGSRLPVLVNFAALTDAQGEIIGAITSFVDITERKQVEDQLRGNSEELARFNQAAVGRELRMIDLKKEVNELREQLGKAPRYPLQFEKETDASNV